jgi:hypothetical protein
MYLISAGSLTPEVPMSDASTRRPSPPWYGAVVTLLLWGGFAWLLAYTLLDLGWQQAIGGWNYVLLLGLVAVLSVLMKGYRPDLRRHG